MLISYVDFANVLVFVSFIDFLKVFAGWHEKGMDFKRRTATKTQELTPESYAES